MARSCERVAAAPGPHCANIASIRRDSASQAICLLTLFDNPGLLGRELEQGRDLEGRYLARQETAHEGQFQAGVKNVLRRALVYATIVPTGTIPPRRADRRRYGESST